jgi:hypothetical protein
VVVTRIVTETGSFFVQLEWGIAAVVTALLGFEAVGPTSFVLLALAMRLLIPDLRETLMPFVTNGLALAERASPGQTLRASGWFLLTLSVGFVVAGAATFYFQYNHSVIQVGNDWATHQVPKQTFDALARLVSEARASGTLLRAAASDGELSLAAVAPASGALWWTGLGFALVLGTSVARLRLPWWPLHPVAFLVWDTYPIIRFGPSFLLGWILATAVVSAGGARAHRAARPVAVGVIAAELSCGLFWIVVGIAYYFTTGQRPVSYSIFPL